MNIGSYAIGVLVLAGVLVPLGLAARLLHDRLLPDWRGALGWLVESVIVLALLFGIAQLLGTIGLLQRIPLVALAVVVGVGFWVAFSGRRHTSAPRVEEVQPERALTEPRNLVVILFIAVAAAPWLAATVRSFQTGVAGYDSLNYHLPFSARFARSGQITPLLFVFPGFETPFNPANAELLHSIGMVAFRRDVLSPLLNLGWLALALLAAWCCGRPRAVQGATLAAAAVVLAGPLFAASNGGRATNDIAGVALLLAGIALLLNGGGRRAATGLAAVACGMALATKLTMVAPVGALTIGLIVAARRAAGQASP